MVSFRYSLNRTEHKTHTNARSCMHWYLHSFGITDTLALLFGNTAVLALLFSGIAVSVVTCVLLRGYWSLDRIAA